MNQEQKNEIILAAVNASGPIGDDMAGWNADVAANAKRLTIMLGETSAVSKAIDSIAESKTFAGTVLSVKKEKSSTRAIVKLKTKPSKFHEDGEETARTERTDSPEGLAMAKSLQSMVGHRVLVWVEVQTYGDGTGKVRVLQHFEDLGVDKDFAEDAA